MNFLHFRADGHRHDVDTAASEDEPAIGSSASDGAPPPDSSRPSRFVAHQRLGAIGRGDATPERAEGLIHEALAVNESNIAAVYDELRNLTWSLLSGSGEITGLPDWFRVIRSTAALAKNRGRTDLSERMRALGELVAQTQRFNEVQSIDSVLERKHVRQLLEALTKTDDWVPRSVVRDVTDLGEANLSRVLKILTGKALVSRSSFGKEASFRLTERGRDLARRNGITAEAQPKAGGIVKFFDTIQGYALIGPDDGGEDVVLHVDKVEGEAYLSLGTRVDFELEANVEGPRTAHNVHVAGDAPLTRSPRGCLLGLGRGRSCRSRG